MSERLAAKAHLTCARCGNGIDICVPVRLSVPDALLCDHPSHGGVRKDVGGEIVCERCANPWRLSGESLTRAVEDAFHRNPDHAGRHGSILIICGDR